MEKLTKGKLEDLLKEIVFDKYYLEATFQFRLMLKLRKYAGDDDCIQPERNIERYELQKEDFVKKEIDIVLEDKPGHPVAALELKMPMKGRIPNTMFKFVEDIQFLEELKDKGKIRQCFFIAVTNDSGFWEGNPKTDGTDIYKYFRSSVPLKGKIFKPTGEGKGVKFHTLTGKYEVQWKNLNGDFRYCIIQV